MMKTQMKKSVCEDEDEENSWRLRRMKKSVCDKDDEDDAWRSVCVDEDAKKKKTVCLFRRQEDAEDALSRRRYEGSLVCGEKTTVEADWRLVGVWRVDEDADGQSRLKTEDRRQKSEDEGSFVCGEQTKMTTDEEDWRWKTEDEDGRWKKIHYTAKL